MIYTEFQDLNLSDDFLFSKVMGDEAVLRPVVEKILGIRIREMTIVQPQKMIEIEPDSKGIRLDIMADDEEGSREGREEGLREGREEGIREGKEAGLQEGKRQGELLAVIQMTRAFISQGKEIEILIHALNGNLDGNAEGGAMAEIAEQTAKMILKDEKLTDEEILMKLSEGRRTDESDAISWFLRSGYLASKQ